MAALPARRRPSLRATLRSVTRSTRSARTARRRGSPACRCARGSTWCTSLSGAMAGLAAVVYLARLNSAEADIGEPLTLPAIAAVLIGGTSLFGGVGSLLGHAGRRADADAGRERHEPAGRRRELAAARHRRDRAPGGVDRRRDTAASRGERMNLIGNFQTQRSQRSQRLNRFLISACSAMLCVDRRDRDRIGSSARRRREDRRLHQEPDQPVFPDAAPGRRQRREADERARDALRADAARQHPRSDEPDRRRHHEAARRGCVRARRLQGHGAGPAEDERREDPGRERHRPRREGRDRHASSAWTTTASAWRRRGICSRR